MTELTDKQRADKLRQVADLMEETGREFSLHTAKEWRAIADHFDPPTDPYDGLDDDQWVEMASRGAGTRAVMHAMYARAGSNLYPTLIRVIPDGDARTHLSIPVDRVRGMVRYAHTSDQVAAHQLLRDALASHDQRWSK